MNPGSATIELTAAPPAASAPRITPRRRKLVLLGGIVAALAVAAAGGRWWLVGRFHQTTDDAFVGADVTVISSRVPGAIARVWVREDQAVRAGDVLVQLDDTDFKTAAARAAAGVQQARSRIRGLDASIEWQRAMIAAANTRVAFAAAALGQAQLDLRRATHLVSGDAIAIQEADRRRTDADKAQADAADARDLLAAAQAQLGVLRAQRPELNAALAIAEAQLTQARLNLGYTKICAPFDGVVGNRLARAGAYVATGTQLMSLVPRAGLYVDANFKESQLAGIRPGQPATIEADIARGEIIHGTVESISPATGAQFSLLPAENATGNFTKIVQRIPVRISLAPDAARLGFLRPGLSVDVDVNER